MATRLNNNNRLHYGVGAVGMAATGDTLFRAVSGVQSVGVDTSFDIEQVYQLGQLGIYSNIENIPNVEVSIERVMDGTALAQHLATPTSGNGSDLIGRYSNERCDVAINFYRDTLSNASGGANGVHQCFMSGMYVSSIGFNLSIDGNFTETVSLVGNSKNWVLTPTKFLPGFGTISSPPTGFISRRQHVVFGTGATPNDTAYSKIPKVIPGIDSSGWNRLDGTGLNGIQLNGYGAHIQSVQISADLGRTELFELGKRGPYHRYLDFPIEVTCAIEVIDTQGDSVIAQTESTTNTTDESIYIVTSCGTIIDLSSKNRLTSVSSSGGDTGGGNRTVTYNFVNYNSLTVTRTAGTGQIGFAPDDKLDPGNAYDLSPFQDGWQAV
jgi:hypothetical protein